MLLRRILIVLLLIAGACRCPRLMGFVVVGFVDVGFVVVGSVVADGLATALMIVVMGRRRWIDD